ncbi:MAG: hypothetical protein JOZ25_07350 [Actinobacteria bacterium]|nr:hypothetical protein [Actinomycetota bacterium]
MSFLRLSRWDWIAFVAALTLLFTMSTIWWTSAQAQECRRGERLQTPPAALRGPESDQFGRELRQSAANCAAKAERNAWQADGGVDRLLLLCLLVTIGAAIVAAFMRAADRRVEPPRTPSAIASVAGLTAALLLLYRILQPPGPNSGAVVEAEAYLALILVSVLAFAARIAALREREEVDVGAGAADAAAPARGPSKAPRAPRVGW